MGKQSQLWVVRGNGSYIGTYRALSARAAIQRAQDDQAIFRSTFRNSSDVLRGVTLVASVEPSTSP